VEGLDDTCDGAKAFAREFRRQAQRAKLPASSTYSPKRRPASWPESLPRRHRPDRNPNAATLEAIESPAKISRRANLYPPRNSKRSGSTAPPHARPAARQLHFRPKKISHQQATPPTARTSAIAWSPARAPLLTLLARQLARTPTTSRPCSSLTIPRAKEVYDHAMHEAWSAKNQLPRSAAFQPRNRPLSPPQRQNPSAILRIRLASPSPSTKWTMRTCFKRPGRNLPILHGTSSPQLPGEVHPRNSPATIGPPCHIRAGITTPHLHRRLPLLRHQSLARFFPTSNAASETSATRFRHPTL